MPSDVASNGSRPSRNHSKWNTSPREALGCTGYGMARDRLVEIQAICTLQVCDLLLVRVVDTGPREQ